MANAALKCKPLRAEIIRCVMKDVAKEMTGLCSKNNPSKCRNSTPQELMDLNVEDICTEWMRRAPIFYAFLMTAGVPSKRKDAASLKSLPSIAVSGAVLLRERCKEMNALQHLISMIIKFSPFQVQLHNFVLNLIVQ